MSTAVLRDATHWDEVVTQLGCEHLRRHDLRHTGLTWMADAGVPLHVLRKIAGHDSLTTTQRYLHQTSAPSPRPGMRSARTWRRRGPQVVPSCELPRRSLSRSRNEKRPIDLGIRPSRSAFRDRRYDRI
ncbi:tyrosine-type recombinase/integrase [Nonomuraea sp. NPDC049655]|uniref:tyrosine-type recombinase/integrase n=1 Tax=Nonomuraea sp. NPDC049655 TaxID=3364355 RepID=UPI0037A0815C